MPILRPPPLWTPSRRQVLGAGAAATLAGLSMPRRARASVSAADRKFLFVYTMGGWDVTRVFTPELLSSKYVSCEPEAEAATVGNITYIDHPDRPYTRAFFQENYEKLCVLNGFYISSISHSAAIRLVLTGATDGMEPDWPSRLAAWRADDHIIPYLVVGGPNFSGTYGVHVGHAGSTGQLQGLARGDILADKSDMPVAPPTEADAASVDAWLATVASRRAAATVGAASRARYDTFGVALERAGQLKAISDTVDLDRGDSFGDQVQLAVRALSMGLCRCTAVSHPLAESNVEWDSHTENDATQTAHFESLFEEMSTLITLLEETPGTVADSLADETVVVILSEMGRTPQINGSNGKDHWPYSAALLWGPGVRGNQVVGEFDETQYGKRVNSASGELDESGSFIGTKVFGATLMTLGDVDPRDEGLVDPPLTAIIED